MVSFRQMLSKLYGRVTGKSGDDDEVTITFSPIPDPASSYHYGLQSSERDVHFQTRPKFTIESDDSNSDSDEDIKVDLDPHDSGTENIDEVPSDQRSRMAKLCERLSGKG